VAGILRPALPGVTFELVGNVPDAARSYAQSVLRAASQVGVEHVGGASAAEVADRLASAMLAFLPFRGGATEKRGSLLAALLNGLVVVTYHSAETPAWIRECTIGVADREQAVEVLKRYIASPCLRSSVTARIPRHLSRFSWEGIAREHVRLYEQLAATA
jgi:glycosyltransferase involved in cell wall biosynthesis